MHESAFRIGELVMQTYSDLPKARILEIGSMDVNGSLRDFAEPTTRYVGVDLEEGPAVDVVVKAGERLPFDDDSFDLIMASSAFEHDPRFWETFVEMCRVAQPGGHIYVNAPSNGGVHRYPLDCWRFYPDAGLALVDYAQAVGTRIELVESFIGKRFPDSWDGWNDFVAIFRKRPSKRALNRDFVYKKFPSYNARTWDSSKLDCETALTEDMQLGRDLRRQLTEQEATLGVTSTELGNARKKLEQYARERVEAEKIRDKLAGDLRVSESEASLLRTAATGLERQAETLSSALRTQTDAFAQVQEQSQRALESLKADLSNLRSEQLSRAGRDKEIIESLKADLSNLRSENLSRAGRDKEIIESLKADFSSLRTEQLSRAERDKEVIDSLKADISNFHSEHLSQMERAAAELAHLQARAAELDTAVENESAQREHYRMRMEWLRATQIAMADRPFWWFLLPVRQRRAREYEVLRSVGLFDGSSYLSRHPDVAAEGADPLRHYFTYGIYEGRDRGSG